MRLKHRSQAKSLAIPHSEDHHVKGKSSHRAVTAATLHISFFSSFFFFFFFCFYILALRPGNAAECAKAYMVISDSDLFDAKFAECVMLSARYLCSYLVCYLITMRDVTCCTDVTGQEGIGWLALARVRRQLHVPKSLCLRGVLRRLGGWEVAISTSESFYLRGSPGLLRIRSTNVLGLLLHMHIRSRQRPK